MNITAPVVAPLPTRAVPTEQILLICGKCTRKLKGGFGKKGKMSLRSVVKDRLKAIGRRGAVRVVETECLGLCPKRAVTVALGTRPWELLTVPAGGDGAALVARLGAEGAG
jgi:predicted metal-binding protein